MNDVIEKDNNPLNPEMMTGEELFFEMRKLFEKKGIFDSAIQANAIFNEWLIARKEKGFELPSQDKIDFLKDMIARNYK